MKKYQKLWKEIMRDRRLNPQNNVSFPQYCGVPVEELSKEKLLILTYKLMEDLGFITETDD